MDWLNNNLIQTNNAINLIKKQITIQRLKILMENMLLLLVRKVKEAKLAAKYDLSLVEEPTTESKEKLQKLQTFDLSFLLVFLVFRLGKTSFAIICYSFYFFLLVSKLCKSGLYIIPYIFEVSRYTIIVYIEEYLVMTYVERLFSTVCCLFNYICWSVNCVM